MLKVGDKVLCRLFNVPENKFYGDYFTAEILDIQPEKYVWYGLDKRIQVKREGSFDIWLDRKEIKRKIKQ